MTGLRVISGKARGRKLRAVPGETTRPVTDRTKEALFNIIGRDIQGATFLDLFAGTGSVGIEALSRDAAYVRFVDLHHRAVKTVRANLKHTHLEARAEVFQKDAFNLLKNEPDRNFDYVYVAPPQYKGMWRRALEMLDVHSEWLSPDAWVIAQIHPVEYEAPSLHILVEFDQRCYGSTQLVFYERIQENQN